MHNPIKFKLSLTEALKLTKSKLKNNNNKKENKNI